MKNLTVVRHSLISDSLSRLRDKTTRIQKFRHHSDKICNLLLSSAVSDLSLEKVEIETPIEKMTTMRLDEEIVFVPVLRSGVAMLFGAMQILPKSKIGFVGLARDEETAQAEEYYWKLPKLTSKSLVVVLDPMLATGGSIAHVLRRILKEKVKNVIVVSVISAPEGVSAIQKEFPNVKIYTGSLDSHLNDKKYIVPGLGDYGDRYFGTE